MPRLRKTEQESIDYMEEGKNLQSYVGYTRRKQPVKTTTITADSVKEALIDYWTIELRELSAYPEWSNLARLKTSTLLRVKSKWGIK
jgi:hypothetical protein